MSCETCQSDRIIHLDAKHNDAFFVRVPHLNIRKEGYAPRIEGVCGGDYTRFAFCLDCGQIQGFESISDEELMEALE